MIPAYLQPNCQIILSIINYKLKIDRFGKQFNVGLTSTNQISKEKQKCEWTLTQAALAYQRNQASTDLWSQCVALCLAFTYSTATVLNSRCNQHLVTQSHLMAITSECHTARHEAAFVVSSPETWRSGRGNGYWSLEI